LGKFDGENWTVYNLGNSGLPSNYVFCLAFDAPGNIWMGTEGGGLGKFDGESWTVYDTANSGLPSDYVSYMDWAREYMDWDGWSWFGRVS